MITWILHIPCQLSISECRNELLFFYVFIVELLRDPYPYSFTYKPKLFLILWSSSFQNMQSNIINHISSWRGRGMSQGRGMGSRRRRGRERGRVKNTLAITGFWLMRTLRLGRWILWSYLGFIRVPIFSFTFEFTQKRTIINLYKGPWVLSTSSLSGIYSVSLSTSRYCDLWLRFILFSSKHK